MDNLKKILFYELIGGDANKPDPEPDVLPAPTLTRACEYAPEFLGHPAVVVIYWNLPEGYSLDNIETIASTSGLGSELTRLENYDIQSTNNTTHFSDGTYRTTIPVNLLDGRLGLESELEVGFRTMYNEKLSKPTTVASNAGLIEGIGGSCRNIDEPSPTPEYNFDTEIAVVGNYSENITWIESNGTPVEMFSVGDHFNINITPTDIIVSSPIGIRTTPGSTSGVVSIIPPSNIAQGSLGRNLSMKIIATSNHDVQFSDFESSTSEFLVGGADRFGFSLDASETFIVLPEATETEPGEPIYITFMFQVGEFDNSLQGSEISMNWTIEAMSNIELTGGAYKSNTIVEGKFVATIIPAPVLTKACEYYAGMLGIGATVRIYWELPAGYGLYDIETVASTSGLGSTLAPLTGFDIVKNTTLLADGSYRTNIPTNLLGGLMGLGSELELGFVVATEYLSSVPATVATNGGLLAGQGGTCRNLS